MSKQENFSQINERVNLYLDHQLNRRDEDELIHQAHSNHDVSNILDTERSFRELIRNNISRKPVSPNLIQSIRSRIKVD